MKSPRSPLVSGEHYYFNSQTLATGIYIPIVMGGDHSPNSDSSTRRGIQDSALNRRQNGVFFDSFNQSYLIIVPIVPADFADHYSAECRGLRR